MPRTIANPPKVRKRAIALARQGHTVAEIARRLKLPYSTVWPWFQKDPIAQEAFRSADAMMVSAARDHFADVLLDQHPIFEARKDKIAGEVLKAAERRPPDDAVIPGKDDVKMVIQAVRDALRDHPEALKAFTQNMKAAKRAALDDAAKSDR